MVFGRIRNVVGARDILGGQDQEHAREAGEQSCVAVES